MFDNADFFKTSGAASVGARNDLTGISRVEARERTKGGSSKPTAGSDVPLGCIPGRSLWTAAAPGLSIEAD